jgi:hypothetical protein
MKSILKLFMLMTLLSLSVMDLMAQPDDSGLWDPVTDTPVNAGIAFMLVAGVGYGMKKLNARKK